MVPPTPIQFHLLVMHLLIHGYTMHENALNHSAVFSFPHNLYKNKGEKLFHHFDSLFPNEHHWQKASGNKKQAPFLLEDLQPMEEKQTHNIHPNHYRKRQLEGLLQKDMIYHPNKF